jgi:Raf kinase inhibitor-like YbhB/YbcL family protein
MSLTLRSDAFEEGGTIPDKHSREGGNISPRLSWSGAPEGTRSLALIVDDPDAPSGVFVHWLLYGIPPSLSGLEENLPANEALRDGMRQGRNGFGDIGYGGPQPPSGTHRYFFHFYALDAALDLRPGVRREELDKAMKGHVLEEAKLMGRFESRKRGR